MAGAYADESCEITAWTGHLPYRSLALSAKALIEGHLGRAESARAAAAEGLELAQTIGLGAGESVQPLGVGVPRAVAG